MLFIGYSFATFFQTKETSISQHLTPFGTPTSYQLPSPYPLDITHRGGQTPTPMPSVQPDAWRPYIDTQEGYQFLYPPTFIWRYKYANIHSNTIKFMELYEEHTTNPITITVESAPWNDSLDNFIEYTSTCNTTQTMYAGLPKQNSDSRGMYYSNDQCGSHLVSTFYVTKAHFGYKIMVEGIDSDSYLNGFLDHFTILR